MAKKLILLLLIIPIVVMILLFAATQTLSNWVEVPVAGIEIITTDEIVYLDVDKEESYTLEYAVYPTTAKNKDISVSAEAFNERPVPDFDFITDEDGKVLAELATGNMANVMFSAKYDNVSAREMRKVIRATFVDGDGNPISKTLSWSVESYVAQTRANSKSTEAQIAVADAMLAYGDSAAAYLTASGQ